MSRARYGIDAPGVIRGFAVVAFFGLLAAYGSWVWFRNSFGFILAVLLGTVAIAAFVLGMSMTMYAFVGKLRLRDWILAFYPWRGDEVVVDIGAGRGLMSIGAAKKVPRGKVIAVDVWRQEDLTGNGAESLTANAIAEGVDQRIQIKTADARELSLETASVDVVLSVLCLHNIEPDADRMKACREIIRVLKPGGQALIADYIGVASYAREFKAAGLHVVQPLGAFLQALGLMRLVIVTRN